MFYSSISTFPVYSLALFPLLRILLRFSASGKLDCHSVVSFVCSRSEHTSYDCAFETICTILLFRCILNFSSLERCALFCLCWLCEFITVSRTNVEFCSMASRMWSVFQIEFIRTYHLHIRKNA
ncbi:hypothetical protein BJ742DRAFT_332270 [Cladochytrium replicatum]|nr:hypothetical protein BJ742DRAFT_332270 [Cladochytrium replicatum]